jgi:hypothetical protein
LFKVRHVLIFQSIEMEVADEELSRVNDWSEEVEEEERLEQRAGSITPGKIRQMRYNFRVIRVRLNLKKGVIDQLKRQELEPVCLKHFLV